MEITALLFLSVWVIVKTSPLSLSQMSSVQKQITRMSGKGAEDGVAMGRGWGDREKGLGRMQGMKTNNNKNNNISQLNFQKALGIHF